MVTMFGVAAVLFAKPPPFKVSINCGRVPPNVNEVGTPAPAVCVIADVAVGSAFHKPGGKLMVTKLFASNGAMVPIVKVTVDTVVVEGMSVAKTKVGAVITPPKVTPGAPAEIMSTVDSTVRLVGCAA